ncbi:bis(5'-nucleosyl)-tetraphosphatase (symmetrical) YqeK [Vagococcus jeotgali]|uniref:bis(5'-nucleosyl)-tetraphosphatase (symmetrical) YqeK n=1 Tax=Vagococcus jeotgali TaxID=3109030 RepID=UPI002DD98BB7|nr:bis(5'-nucleosyl)-tetraphosphatase (symmetrical) YqeK [Vagococcus sp. B2T-5]
MIYTDKYIMISRDELLEKVANQMSNHRFQHVLRVEKKALELARRYHVNLEQASIAALVHDYAKERDDGEMIKLIKSQDFSKELLEYGNPIWHGIVGAYIIEEELGITDQDILDAVRLHTTGAANMSELSKLIYVADYIEEGRDFPGVDEARKLSEIDLDEAVKFEAYQTLNYLLKRKQRIYPKSIETYNTWVVNN